MHMYTLSELTRMRTTRGDNAASCQFEMEFSDGTGVRVWLHRDPNRPMVVVERAHPDAHGRPGVWFEDHRYDPVNDLDSEAAEDEFMGLTATVSHPAMTSRGQQQCEQLATMLADELGNPPACRTVARNLMVRLITEDTPSTPPTEAGRFRVWAREADRTWAAVSGLFDSRAVAAQWAQHLNREYAIEQEDED